MKTITIIFSLLFGQINTSGQIPNIKHNFTHQDSIESNAIMAFARKFDFVIAYTELSYWNGYKKEYQVLSYSKNKWTAWTYIGYYDESTKLKVDSIRNGKFLKAKRTPTSIEVSELLTELNNNDFWSLDNDSLNKIYHSYYIDEDTGDTLGTRKRAIAGDGITYRFKILTKPKIRIIQSYEPYPDIIERKRFVASKDKYLVWWNKYCR